ncbi:phosphonate ABC transporter, permease protein PhnE [Pseudorhodoplanes sinuspersici]|uniref:Phosphonate ABC transporter, permease protein PhnE n=1 Tax=Pseudorhodoplanes sinuspersici TaxID=1235591 RepID=A0A1W6ZYQ2_9HYPH|nr:phosphonate ABC transporter, permease protein PhnE [Pseudorhodoplanes sinuspersici]ARQ02512.1 phosphonate ABC transporter, permease protein PhnE [Pseudorhodoplanes sinuspersici]RKE74352.1 phosphonate transport system permease protein [Pseudorhodoplanes sinuspersici]
MTDASLPKPEPLVPQQPLSRRMQSWILFVTLVAILAWSWSPAEMYRFTAIFTDWRNMAEFGQAFLKPNFLDWRAYVSDMVVTVQIAIWGTALAAVVGAPFAILASSNISPTWIVQPIRRLMDACRAINEIVFALLFVVAVGLGPFAGVMALFIHNIGVFSKLYSEAVEAIDPRPVEGIRATGAHRLPEIIFGVIPQVIPLWSSYALYRLETNVRSATTLGIVGAGGIGQTLYESIRSFHYGETAAQMIIVVVTVIIIDMISAQLRKRLI